jgi:hypothetical protein
VSRQKRTPGLGAAPVTRARGGARDRVRDAGGKELALLAKKVGNSQVGALLGAATGKRDALLAFVERRIAEIQQVQRAEQKEMADRRDWHLLVARGATGFTLPDPTRWHHATLLYRRAAEALCAGDIGRGAQLLDQAVAAERATFETVPAQVELPGSLAAPTMGPEERPFVSEGETCPATKAPALFQQADAILRVTTTSPEVPVRRDNPTHNWWDVAEEEKADAAGKKDAKKAAPEAVAVERGPAAKKIAEAERPVEVEERGVAVTPEREVEVEVQVPAAEATRSPPRKEKKPDGR